MIDLKQKALKEWQEKNFPRDRYEAMTKDQLIDMILSMQFALGMAEEVGEVCHHLLKGIQGIRGGVCGIEVEAIADGIVDTLIFGEQLLSSFDINAEEKISTITDEVLRRDWKEDPTGENAGPPFKEEIYCECSKNYLVCSTHIDSVSGAIICDNCKLPIKAFIIQKPVQHHPV